VGAQSIACLCQNFRQKIKTFLGHEYFPLKNQKCDILFKNLLLNLPFLILYKKVSSFFTDTVADLAVRYTLCERYTLYAHCRLLILAFCKKEIFYTNSRPWCLSPDLCHFVGKK